VRRGPEFALAARKLYGALTYLDDVGGAPSPVGDYPSFLQGMDDKVKDKLHVSHVQDFLLTASQRDLQKPCVIMWMLDEANAVVCPQVWPGPFVRHASANIERYVLAYSCVAFRA